jgi:hypothetical protein
MRSCVDFAISFRISPHAARGQDEHGRIADREQRQLPVDAEDEDERRGHDEHVRHDRDQRPGDDTLHAADVALQAG